MSQIRDKVRKDIQEDLENLVELESCSDDIKITMVTFTKSLCQATTNADTIEKLQNKFSFPIIQKKIK